MRSIRTASHLAAIVNSDVHLFRSLRQNARWGPPVVLDRGFLFFMVLVVRVAWQGEAPNLDVSFVNDGCGLIVDRSVPILLRLQRVQQGEDAA